MSGVGSINVFASKTAVIDASGIGSVNVNGNPERYKKSVSGIGSVTIR